MLRLFSNIRKTLVNEGKTSKYIRYAVGEVLLCPRPLGLLSLNGSALTAFRAAFSGGKRPIFEGPASVTYHPFDGAERGTCVVQNFNDEAVEVSFTLPADRVRLVDRFSREPIPAHAVRSGDAVRLTFTIPARDRIWVHPTEDGVIR